MQERGEAHSKRVTKNELASRMGVTRRAVDKAVDSGRIDAPDNNATFDPERAIRDWQEHTDLGKPLNAITGNPKQRKINGASSPALSKRDPDADKYFAARAEKEDYAAKHAKLEYEQALGELVSREQIESDMFTAARMARDKIDALADSLSGTLASTSDVRKCYEIIRVACRRVLEELAQALESK